MAEKYLFERFNEDKRVYNLNQGYWKRKLQSRLKEKLSRENILFNNIDSRGQKIYDANPIFTYIDSSRQKGIRIIQDDISLLKGENLDNIENHLISAWLDEIDITPFNYQSNKEPKKIKELVIALFLTPETVEKSMQLVLLWLKDELNREMIDELLNQ